MLINDDIDIQYVLSPLTQITSLGKDAPIENDDSDQVCIQCFFVVLHVNIVVLVRCVFNLCVFKSEYMSVIAFVKMSPGVTNCSVVPMI